VTDRVAKEKKTVTWRYCIHQDSLRSHIRNHSKVTPSDHLVTVIPGEVSTGVPAAHDEQSVSRSPCPSSLDKSGHWTWTTLRMLELEAPPTTRPNASELGQLIDASIQSNMEGDTPDASYSQCRHDLSFVTIECRSTYGLRFFLGHSRR
jgi:hypothetical protein